MAGENTGIVREQGGTLLRVDSGSSIDIKTGGKVLTNGAQASAITDALTAGSATAADCATKINSILTTLRNLGIIAP